ncbi:efflux RND transporter periplasmic adaptor subunit [Desulfovibrio ferrophilus]|uniref:RND family efflux transporter, MFP subunit n=1 Tax=Desulfovibrio ferrophilus TaxID=241368 RepID=A0A2Z6AVM8_9BACT|nr:efflux RND transporter periplasmic adaptor subunit [Desulfovibrio ferrophilus]BBD07294.1 RND family efflux transporter, MFP subunit [Desulfovibrio ferrophilus]
MKLLRGIIVSVMLVGLLGMLSGCGEKTAEAEVKSELKATERIVQVAVSRVEPVVLSDILTLPGETEASQDVTLSAETSGRVEWIGPAEGGRVAKGQPIMKINVASLRAQLDKAQAALRLAEQQAQRRSQLFAKGVVSREELDETLTVLDQARASAGEAQANYRYGQVLSPVDGVVDELHVDSGEFVDKATNLVDIVNRDVVRVYVSVPELDVRYLNPGDKVRVTVDAWAGRDWTGKIDFISSKADSGTRTFRTRVLVDNADGAIRPGMLARASFLRREIADAVAVPLSSIQDRGGERVLYVEDKGVARSRTVKVGVVQGGLVQVVDGLIAGENLIVAGQAEVEEGVKVSVQ